MVEMKLRSCKRCHIDFPLERSNSKERICSACRVSVDKSRNHHILKESKITKDMSKEQILEILNRATIIKEFSINLVKFSGVNEAMKATKRNSLHARICRECGTKYMVYKISGSRCPECKSHMSIEYEGGDINNLDIDPFTNALIENKK